jgi:type II secretory pathway component PulL
MVAVGPCGRSGDKRNLWPGDTTALQFIFRHWTKLNTNTLRAMLGSFDHVGEVDSSVFWVLTLALRLNEWLRSAWRRRRDAYAVSFACLSSAVSRLKDANTINRDTSIYRGSKPIFLGHLPDQGRSKRIDSVPSFGNPAWRHGLP